MPASSSDTRGRWRKKRKRGPQASQRPKHQDDDLDEDEEEDDDLEQQPDFDEDQPLQNPRSGSDPAPIEVLSDGGVRISDFPPAIRHTVNRPHPSVLSIAALERAIQRGESRNLHNSLVLENISHGQLQALSAIPVDCPSLLAAGEMDRADGSSSTPSYVITPPPILEGRGVVKRFWGNRVLIVPMHADWFSPTTVYRLERQVVPHFFSGKSSDHMPEKYMECRNWIVAKYMENPVKRLSIADCHELVTGIDSDDLARIFRFLDHWGIINFCVDAPNHDPQSDGSYLKEESTGEVQVPSAALKSIDSLIQFDKPKCRVKAAEVYPALSSQSDEKSDLDSQIRELLSDNRCCYCSCSVPIVYYQSQKESDTVLCLDCFCDGRFVTGHSSIDFIKVDTTKDYGDLDGENWTDQETLLLLEAMEIYNENWNEIAEHVGTKSKAQCILHFIRVQVEDDSLENIEVPNQCSDMITDHYGTSQPSSNGVSAGFQDSDPECKLPFENSANPVMALVAFLASAVGPRVAAACAHASLAVLSEVPQNVSDRGNRMNSEGSSHGEHVNSKDNEENGQWIQNGEVALPSMEKVRSATKAGLAAAATKAKLFADHEEREIQRLSANIVNNQLKRLELKLKQFAEVETMLMKECEQTERSRQRIATERTRMMSAVQFGSPTGVTSSVNLPGIGPNSPANSRQQGIAGSPSQPFISSGYNNTNNNQAMHPQFMARQSMYGLGPRLPLSALHPSSSAAQGNAMFSSPPNAQPGLTHPMIRPVSGTSSGLG